MSLFSLMRKRRHELVVHSPIVRPLNFGFALLRQRAPLQLAPNDYKRLIRDYSRWSESMKRNATPLNLGLPWLPFQCIDFLADFIHSGDRVFEYGSGGSTVFLAMMGATGTSIEHDDTWALMVDSTLEEIAPPNSWELRNVPPTLIRNADDRNFMSSNQEWLDFTFRDYVCQIDEYPIEHFALIAIDGRARNACIRRAFPHVRPGGAMLIDNSERLEYATEIERLIRRGWEHLPCSGPIPTEAQFGRTSILLKPT